MAHEHPQPHCKYTQVLREEITAAVADDVTRCVTGRVVPVKKSIWAEVSQAEMFKSRDDPELPIVPVNIYLHMHGNYTTRSVKF